MDRNYSFRRFRHREALVQQRHFDFAVQRTGVDIVAAPLCSYVHQLLLKFDVVSVMDVNNANFSEAAKDPSSLPKKQRISSSPQKTDDKRW